MTKKFIAHITVNGTVLPVEVVQEPRNGHRYSVTRKRIGMRIPMKANEADLQKHLNDLEVRVTQWAAKRTALLAPFIPKEYRTGDVLQVGTRQYVLDILVEDRGSHTGKLVGNTVALRLSTRSTPAARTRAIKTLLSRIVAGDYQAEIEQRVLAWNRRTFNRQIKGVFLKYNHSNWGSCSHNGNINLSTRLLFAPEPVQDYVILHELAHLVELNHSDRFWKLVEDFMPDYASREKWLSKFGGTCDF